MVLRVLNAARPEFWAESGSPEDVQKAVNEAAAVNGIVHVPEGEWVFNPPRVQWGRAVQVVGGVDVIGAGIGKTILKQTNASTLSTYFFALDGSNGKPIRISGFTLKVEYTEDNFNPVGITVDSALDFRIDHVEFLNCSGMGIYVEDSRGVIDHCIIDNPYKDLYQPHNPSGPSFAVWAYGIIITAPNMPWQNSISYYLGQYKDYIVYIEDCTFRRCRHAIASNNRAWYVVRHCHFEKSSPYGQVDVHGGTPGGRGHEVYSNTFDLSDESYSLGQDSATEPRGGGGIVWNNTVIINTNYPTKTVGMGNDGQSSPYDVRQYYIWGNTAYDHNHNLIDFNSRIDPWNYQENVNYFLRAPNQQQDGFTYTPYPYPHPLVQEVAPYVTPWTGELEEGMYRITVPSQVQVGSDIYNFKQWEDGTTNPVRTINLTADKTITAIYEKVTVTHTLTIIARTGGTTNPPPGSYTLSEGTQQTVTAIPDANYRFANWLLDGVSRTENPITVTMDTDHTLEAVFEYVPPPPLTATIKGVITDETTGLPVAGATVTCNGYADVTEVDGSYIFENIPAQRYILKVSKAGYREEKFSVDASSGGTFTVDISISPTPTPPPTVVGPLGVWRFPILTWIIEFIRRIRGK